MSKSLENKAIDIKGKKYVLVSDRIIYFNETYPDGFITTELLSPVDAETVIVKATAHVPLVHVVPLHHDSTAVKSYDDIVIEWRTFTGHSQATWGDGYINKTSALENAECVPLRSRILTLEGFKFYHQVKVGDRVVNYNPTSNRLDLDIVHGVSVYEDQPTITAKTSRFKATFTPNHKWFINNKLVPFNEAKSHEKVQLIPYSVSDVEPSELGLKLGWLLGDCELKYTKDGLVSTAYIRQSKHVSEVTKLFGEGRKVKKYNDKWLDAYEWIIPAAEVRRIFGYFGINSYEELPDRVCQYGIEDLKGIYTSLMLSDGSARDFAKCDLKLVQAVQIICTLLGIKTGKISVKKPSPRSTRDLYILPIHKTTGAYISEMKISHNPPEAVWCPTTENGNWIMEQDGYVSVTGNTSAVGRALAMMGIGVIDSIASADEINKTTVTKPKEDKPWMSEINFKAAAEMIASGDVEGAQSYADGFKMSKHFRDALNAEFIAHKDARLDLTDDINF